MAGSFCRHRIEEMNALLGALEGVASGMSGIAECSRAPDGAECQALHTGIDGIGATVTVFREVLVRLDENLSGLEELAGISAEKPERT